MQTQQASNAFFVLFDMSQPPPDQRDVRMRGFARRTTVEAALTWVDDAARPLASEAVSLWQAAGRVLAQPVVSPVAVPAFRRSMMDGFALRAADSLGATSYSRLTLSIAGESLPARPFAGSITSGQAVRIMTGAEVPAGADAVIPAERVEVVESQLLLLDEVPPGKNVGQIGEDIAPGTSVLPEGRVLRPQDIGLLSSIGADPVVVVRRPRVRIVITGDELLPAGSAPAMGRTIDANGPMLAALVERDGGLPTLGGDESHKSYIVRDNPGDILAAMACDADVVLVSGGSSVGQEDHAAPLLAQHGELAIHGIAMRPSSPSGMGRMGGKLVFLLPGNPVSCLCAYDFFAGRAIRRLGGRGSAWPYTSVRLPLVRKLVSQVGRVDYARVRISGGQVEPIATSGASILSSTTAADGFVVVPADSEGYAEGAMVEVYLYDAPGCTAK